MRKVLLFLIMALVPSLMMAQAAGGTIKRQSRNASKSDNTTKRSNTANRVDKSSFLFDYVGTFNEGMAAVKLNGKFGFVDTTGKEVIPCKYDLVRFFSDGLAPVSFNGKWGIVDKKGNLLHLKGK